MVDVKGREADRFIQRPPAHIYVYLVCGVDAGLVSERMQRLAAVMVDDPSSPFEMVTLEGDAIAADPQRLADEVYTISMFGGRRLIRIYAGARNLAPAFEGILQTPPENCTILVAAGNLRAESPLRRLLAKSRDCAVLECWPDNDQQLDELIDEEISSAGLRITLGARQMLIGSLGVDRLATRAELSKLILFARKQESITEDDVAMIVADAGAVALDDCILSAFSGDYEVSTLAAVRALLATDASVLLTLASRHALMLHRLVCEIAGGKTVEAAMEKLPRAIFGRKRTAIAQQLRKWRAADLLLQSERLSVVSQQARREPRLAEELTLRTMWTIANVARRR